jgi:hypothetical protein
LNDCSPAVIPLLTESGRVINMTSQVAMPSCLAVK